MDEQRREQIQKIVEHFGRKVPNATVLSEYCKRMKFENLVPSDFTDYVAQLNHDEKMATIFPKIMEALQKLTYVPEFASAEYRKKLTQANDEVRVEIVKVLENEGLEYKFTEPTMQELAQTIGGTVSAAGKTAGNKAAEVLMHLALKHFDAKDLTMKHVADYAVEVFEKAEKEKKAQEK